MLTFIDSNVFIFSQLSDAPENSRARAQIAESKDAGDLAVNAIIVSESFHILSKLLGTKEALTRLALFLDSKRVLYFAIEKDTMQRAMRLAERASIRINDAIIAQHSLDIKSDELLTDNVKHFGKMTGLRVSSFRR